MARPVLLNNVDHNGLRVITRFGPEFGDDVGVVHTFPTEYADMQREYPIFFRKDPATGEYQSIALLGFGQRENLFLEDGRWNASYVPGLIARGPFLIGFQEQQVDGAMRKEPVIHVDLDNPRVSRSEGEPVFLPHGGNSPYLEHIALVLRGIRAGLEVNKAMVAAFSALELIEPVKLEVKLSEQEGYNLVGLHTISQPRLAALPGKALEELNKSGFLQGAYLVLASMTNVKRLMGMKQRRQARKSAAGGLA
jgi:SapC protein